MISDKLKKSLLHAAIQGKLISNSSEDGDTNDLLKEIILAKKIHLNNIKKKKKKVYKDLKVIEIPFDIPDNWVWKRLGEIVINRDAERRPVSKLQRNSLDKVYDYYGASGVIDKINNYIFSEELLLISEDGANLLARKTPIAFIANGKYWVNNHAHVLEVPKAINIKYLCYYINAINISQYVTGTAQPKMNQEKMNSIPIAIPPLPMQERIVAKLDHLLEAIEALKVDELKLNALYKKIPFRIKESLLNSAFKGKITKQNNEDGDAQIELKEIFKKNTKNTKKNGSYNYGVTNNLEKIEPYDIPNNWSWTKLGDIGYWASGATPLKSNNKYYKNGTIPWLRTGDLNDSTISSASEYITELALKETSVKMFPKGTVLIAMYGATIGKVGILDFESTTNQACCGCIVFNGVYNKYLFYYLMSIKKEFINQGVGGAQPNISKEKIIKNLIPMPPYREQVRIVERLEKLLPLCDTLI